MWIVRAYNTDDDQLIAEHELRGVTQAQIARALGFVPSAYASTPLDLAALQNLDGAFPGRLGEPGQETWEGREYFLDSDAGAVHESSDSSHTAAATARR